MSCGSSLALYCHIRLIIYAESMKLSTTCVIKKEQPLWFLSSYHFLYTNHHLACVMTHFHEDELYKNLFVYWFLPWLI